MKLFRQSQIRHHLALGSRCPLGAVPAYLFIPTPAPGQLADRRSIPRWQRRPRSLWKFCPGRPGTWSGRDPPRHMSMMRASMRCDACSDGAMTWPFCMRQTDSGKVKLDGGPRNRGMEPSCCCPARGTMDAGTSGQKGENEYRHRNSQLLAALPKMPRTRLHVSPLGFRCPLCPGFSSPVLATNTNVMEKISTSRYAFMHLPIDFAAPVDWAPTTAAATHRKHPPNGSSHPYYSAPPPRPRTGTETPAVAPVGSGQGL